jgi:hypothetical protein
MLRFRDQRRKPPFQASPERLQPSQGDGDLSSRIQPYPHGAFCSPPDLSPWAKPYWAPCAQSPAVPGSLPGCGCGRRALDSGERADSGPAGQSGVSESLGSQSPPPPGFPKPYPGKPYRVAAPLKPPKQTRISVFCKTLDPEPHESRHTDRRRRPLVPAPSHPQVPAPRDPARSIQRHLPARSGVLGGLG